MPYTMTPAERRARARALLSQSQKSNGLARLKAERDRLYNARKASAAKSKKKKKREPLVNTLGFRFFVLNGKYQLEFNVMGNNILICVVY